MLKLPSFLKPFPSQPNDPPKCDNFAAVMRDNFNCMVRRYPIPTQYTNPWDEVKTVEIVHSQLDDDQGLIEVEKGETNSGVKYIAAITKTYMGPQYGVQYFLRFNYIIGDDWSEEIDAFFGEEGTTGTRDTIVMAKLGMPKDWMQDPYDKEFKKGILMNKSELKDFDKHFPNHPLTQARSMLNFLIKNN